MKKSHINTFNRVYSLTGCYYGMALREEFTDYFENRDISGKTALDLGCGEGRYALFLAGRGCLVTAVDRSRAGIHKLNELAKKHQVAIQTHQTDIKDFVFPKGCFDIIVAATVLDHLPDALRSKTIHNIKSALAPGGITYVNVFTISDPGYKTLKDGSHEPTPADISDTAVCMEYYFNPGELKSLFKPLEMLFYHEGVEPDLSHGRPHHHGWACLLARRSTI